MKKEFAQRFLLTSGFVRRMTTGDADSAQQYDE